MYLLIFILCHIMSAGFYKKIKDEHIKQLEKKIAEETIELEKTKLCIEKLEVLLSIKQSLINTLEKKKEEDFKYFLNIARNVRIQKRISDDERKKLMNHYYNLKATYKTLYLKYKDLHAEKKKIHSVLASIKKNESNLSASIREMNEYVFSLFIVQAIDE